MRSELAKGLATARSLLAVHTTQTFLTHIQVSAGKAEVELIPSKD